MNASGQISLHAIVLNSNTIIDLVQFATARRRVVVMPWCSFKNVLPSRVHRSPESITINYNARHLGEWSACPSSNPLGLLTGT